MISITEDIDYKSLPNEYIYYFYATWIPKSIATNMYKMIDKVGNDFNIITYAIDIDSFKSYIKIYELKSVPTLCLFKNKQMIKKIEGYILTTAYKAVLREIYINKEVNNGTT